MGHNKDKTHCRHGHAFTPENTYWFKKKTGEKARICRTCSRARHRSYRAEGRYKNAAWKEKQALQGRAYRQTPKGKEIHRNNKAKIKERYLTDEAYREKRKQQGREKYHKDPEYFRSRARANNDALVDTVVMRNLSRYFGGTLLYNELKKPENRWLIELERARLKLKRLIHEKAK